MLSRPSCSLLKGRRAWALYALLLLTVIFLIIVAIQQDSQSPFQVNLACPFSAGNPPEQPATQLPSSDSIIDVGKKCKTIPVALVCGGYNATRTFYVLLKSILFHRTDHIHLHLFVDDISSTILSRLFDTWPVPNLSVDFYNISEHEREIAWITGQHYSHRFALIKLLVPTILYERGALDRVIMLDTDLLAIGNLRHLWNAFDRLKGSKSNSTAALGMVENFSDWYLASSRPFGVDIWPALGRGFNSGVVLADLLELNRLGWPELWRDIAEKYLTSNRKTSLADQDIINAVAYNHPTVIRSLPCYFNLQLNDLVNLDKRCPARGELTLVHWNSPQKLASRNPYAKFYQSRYLNMFNWDADFLRAQVCFGKSASDVVESMPMLDTALQQNEPESELEQICEGMRPRPSERLRTYLYFKEFEIVPREDDVTLAVHLSLDRLQTLEQLVKQWPGPISAAVYLAEQETNLLLESLAASALFAQRKNIGLHLIFRPNSGFSYPINRLRNVALENVRTPNVFLTDVDFMPGPNLYDYLRQSSQSFNASAERYALVVPAFENLQYKFEVPENKAELLQQLNLGSISPFREQIWPQGHAQTDYARWREATQPYRVDWRPDYEPFVMVQTKQAPRFDGRFVGFGWNKVEHVMKLAALNYQFFVLPSAFVVHKLHSASYDIMAHRESARYRLCIDSLKRMFVGELLKEHPDFRSKVRGAAEATRGRQVAVPRLL